MVVPLRNEKGQFNKGIDPWNKNQHTEQVPWNKGKKDVYSEETLQKLSQSHMGQKAWNKGKRCPKIALTLMGHAVSELTRWKLSEFMKGRPSLMKGKKYSRDVRLKMSKAHKGQKAWNKGIQLTEEQRRKISEATKGRHKQQVPWNKARKGTINNGSFKKGHSSWMKGRHHTEQTKKKLREINKGKHYSEQSRQKQSDSIIKFYDRIGRKERQERFNYKDVRWRKAIIKKSHHTCYICGAREGMMHAHHILSYLYSPEARNLLTNGVCLCTACHHAIHRGLNINQYVMNRATKKDSELKDRNFLEEKLMNFVGKVLCNKQNTSEPMLPKKIGG
jgi:hypothetical protein